MAPQWALLVAGSTQVPPQSTRPAWQVRPQVPLEHTFPAAQTAPALPPWQSPVAPQWALLVDGSTQVPPQLTRPAWQVRPQVPLEHTFPAAQTAPALPPWQSPVAPQWTLLVAGSTQAPPQSTRPAWQVRPQVPTRHICPATQTTAQSPQWAGSFVRSLHRFPHNVWPEGQAGEDGAGLLQENRTTASAEASKTRANTGPPSGGQECTRLDA